MSDVEREDEEVVEATITEPLTEEELAAIPQNEPTGIRVGWGDEPKTDVCPTCHGKGTYPVEAFTPPDDAGERQVYTIDQPCTVCYGTGKIQVI